MKRPPFFSTLLFCFSALTVRAGVQEDYPDFFPKESASATGKNGWDLVSSMKPVSMEDWKGMPNLLELGPEQLSRLDVKKTRELAAKYAGELRLLEEIMAAPRLESNDWRTYKLDDSSKSLIGNLRTVGLMLCKAVADARDGDKHQAMETGLRITRFGLKTCEAGPMLADLIFASILIRYGAGTAACAATMPGFDSAALRKAAQDMEACDNIAAVMRRGLRGEARHELLFCESLVKGGEARKDAVLEMAVFKEWETRVLEAAKKKNSESAEMSQIREQWKQSMPEKVQGALRDADKVDWKAYLKSEGDYFRAIIKADNRSLIAFRASFHPPETIEVTKGTALESYFDSSPSDGTEKGYIHTTVNASARVRMARAILLLRAYELDHGGLPASLDELVPGYWSSVPEDPFDGKPLRYDATTRRVWCVGENLKDDKGVNDSKAEDKPDDAVMTFPLMK